MRNNSTIGAMILPTVEALGYELWGCVDLTQARYRLLRIYIDHERGITLADCERVSRQVAALLDVEHPGLARYRLEVSSPGLDRPLFTAEQFKRFLGHCIQVCTDVPVAQQRRFKGLLRSIAEEGITVDQGGTALVLTWGNIRRANVMPKIIQ